jgi:hypothetical protein
MTSSSAETAKITYYRKTFTKARGCINEVNELADATALLTDSCARAVAGDSDIEQVLLITSFFWFRNYFFKTFITSC